MCFSSRRSSHAACAEARSISLRAPPARRHRPAARAHTASSPPAARRRTAPSRRRAPGRCRDPGERQLGRRRRRTAPIAGAPGAPTPGRARSRSSGGCSSRGGSRTAAPVDPGQLLGVAEEGEGAADRPRPAAPTTPSGRSTPIASTAFASSAPASRTEGSGTRAGSRAWMRRTGMYAHCTGRRPASVRA
jgi:hypothetical protein